MEDDRRNSSKKRDTRHHTDNATIRSEVGISSKGISQSGIRWLDGEPALDDNMFDVETRRGQ